MSSPLTTNEVQRFESVMRSFANALEVELVHASEFRHRLHGIATLSGDEGEATEAITEMMGIELLPVAGTGGVARIGSASSGAIAIRAELDALPMAERTGVDWASTNGHMHACGHDVHQAALVALVRAAMTVADSLPAPIVPVLQPREEAYPSGAHDIVESGLLDRLGVTAVIGAHVHPRVSVGEVAAGYGPINAAADSVEVRFSGGGGHGAYPHEASSPVLAIAHTVSELESLVRRTVSPMHPAVISVGHIESGSAANVVPTTGSLSVTVRSMRQKDRDRLHTAINEVADRNAAVQGLTVEVDIVNGEPVLENTPALVDEFNRLSHSEGRNVIAPMRSCGSDDFSFYSAKYRSLMAFVGVETEGVDLQPSLHHARFLPTERSVGDVARALLIQYRAAAAVVVAEAVCSDSGAPERKQSNSDSKEINV